MPRASGRHEERRFHGHGSSLTRVWMEEPLVIPKTARPLVTFVGLRVVFATIEALWFRQYRQVQMHECWRDGWCGGRYGRRGGRGKRRGGQEDSVSSESATP